MRSVNIQAGPGEAVVVYSDDLRVVLQVRRLVHGAEDVTAASFKSGVTLDELQASQVAVELLKAAAVLGAARIRNLQSGGE